MHRAFAILKYLPAVLCGLLVVAWVVSLFVEIGVIVRLPDWNEQPSRATIILFYPHAEFYFRRDEVARDTRSTCFVRPATKNIWSLRKYWQIGVAVPIPFAVTILLPFSVAPLTRFRFPLWSYFVWTALVAAELAYYLR
jgi:hypothetical protein